MLTKLRRSNRLVLILLLLGGGLVIASLLASAFGAVTIPLPDILKMVLNKITVFDFPSTWRAVDETIIFQIRLPRVIGGAFIGAALATAGVLFQGLLRNPMADPYIIGTSAGVALGANIAMMLSINLASLYFDRLILLKEGKVSADGAPSQVLTEARIKEVFSASVRVESHPITGVPHIMVIPKGSAIKRQ